MTDLRDLNRRGWQLYDTARAAGLCGSLADAYGDAPAADGLHDVRACHLSRGHRGPHAARWLGQLIAWDAEPDPDGPLEYLTATTVDLRGPHRHPSEPDPESSGAFLRRVGVDSALWAQEFAKAFGGDPTPGGTLHGWVCNMIEAGRAAGYWEARRQRARGDAIPAEVSRELEATAVALTRDVLIPGLVAAGVDRPERYHVEIDTTPLRLQPSTPAAGDVSPAAECDTSSPPAGSTPPPSPICSARTVFWPDDEQIDVTCMLLAGHLGDHCEGNGGTWSRDTDTEEVPDQHGDPVAAWVLLQLSNYPGSPWELEGVRLAQVDGELRRLRDVPGAWVSLIGRRTTGSREPLDVLARELRRWLDSSEGREQCTLPGAPVLDREGLLTTWAPAARVVVMGVSQFDARHHGELLTRLRSADPGIQGPEFSHPVYRSGVVQTLQTLRGTSGYILAVTPIALAEILQDQAARSRPSGQIGEALAAARVAGVYACFPPVD